MRFFRPKESGVEVDMTPLIDMTFILLIFFMVSTTFTQDMHIELDRPGAASAQRTPSTVIKVHVDRRGALFLDGAPVKPWMLQSRVRDLIRAGGVRSALVVTDKNVPAEKLIEVVDQCRLGGASHVGVATDKEAG